MKQKKMNNDSRCPTELKITADEEEILNELGLFGESRRRFLGHIGAAGLSLMAFQQLLEQNVFAGTPPIKAEDAASSSTVSIENGVQVAFKVNNAEKSLEVDSRMTLLDALRERLDLTGSKKGCDHGQCGACTVLLDGRRVLSCLTLAATCEGKNITTIEGLASGEELHPMQAAFVKHDGFQCGYCTPGQICSAIAVLQEAKNGDASFVTIDVRQKPRSIQLSDEEIRERMSGNICRCGAYPNIVAAIREVHTGQAQAQAWQFAGENNTAIFEDTGKSDKGDA